MKALKNSMLGVAAGAIIALSTPVFSADLVYEQPPITPMAPIIHIPSYGWDGSYAGIAVGYGFSGRTNYMVPSTTVMDPITNQPLVFPAYNATIQTKGLILDGFLGWQAQSDAFVYGIEADVGYSGIKGTNTVEALKSKSGAEASLRARLGFVATDNVLVYATGGGTISRNKIKSTMFDNFSASRNHLGWTAGAGVDVKIMDKAFARLEYRYTSLDKKNYYFPTSIMSAKLKNHRIMVGLGMQF